MTDDLTQALEQLVDRLDDAKGNWDDVIRRATVEPTRRPSGDPTDTKPSRRARRSRRRLLVVASVILGALLALMATPAFGLRDALFDLIGGKPVHFGSSSKAPSVIRYQFEDMALGAPARMAPQVIPSETRKVGELKTGGRAHALYVAPTRTGGFCYQLEGAYGGCQRTGRGFTPPLTLTFTGGVSKSSKKPSIMTIGGTVFGERTATVTIEFGDGTHVNVPFLYVLTPIDAGFFLYDVPANRRNGTRAPTALVSRDASGDEIWREPIPNPDTMAPTHPPRERLVPQKPLPAHAPGGLTAPVRQVVANGGVVTVGRTGAAEFDLTELDAARKRLLIGSKVGYGCFKLLNRDGKPYARGYNTLAPFRTRAGIRSGGLLPVDGCEVQASGGHLWPDKLDSHSAVEFALTDSGRRYYQDRAAARDLALLVRSRTVQKIRKLPAAQAAAALDARYGDQISPLAKPTQRPPSGSIGYVANDGSLVFVRISETGRRFQVIITDGRIASQNVKPWAFVF